MPLQDADVKEITGRMDIMIKLMAALFARELSNIDAIVKLENMKLSREQISKAMGSPLRTLRSSCTSRARKAKRNLR